MCPLYVSGLIGPGDRKSVQPMAARLAPGDYDQLHHFIADGVWDAAPLEAELLVHALDGSKWDGLYVGRRKGDDLIYAGKVDHGFDKVSAADLRKRLEPLVRKTQAFAKRIAHKGIWVEPKLLAEIEYRAKSAEGKVRHPFFKGLREDL